MEILGWLVGIVLAAYVVFQLCGLTAGLLDLFIKPTDKDHKS